MHAQMSTLILTLILVCHYGQVYQLLFLHLSGSGVANVTLLLPNMSLQNEDDILEHLNEVNNDEAFQQICDLLKQHQKAKQFVEKLKETFTDVDVSHPTRVHQYAVEFVNEFRNKVKGATLRAERACGFEKFYNKDSSPPPPPPPTSPSTPPPPHAPCTTFTFPSTFTFTFNYNYNY